MLEIVKAPNKYEAAGKRMVFLGGVIDNGAAEDWQKKVEKALKNYDILILNPRRDNWNPNLSPTTDCPEFVEQVTWEMKAQFESGVIIYVFGSNEEQAKLAKAPVTMLELGTYGTNNKKEIYVCCPKGYWRKGNVDLFCAEYDIPVVENIDALITLLKSKLKPWHYNYDSNVRGM